eukprot:gene7771-9565_t
MFEQEIANQLSTITEIPSDKILECVEAPKNKDLADFAVPVPKLNKYKKLAGKPNELAELFASKIQLNDLITKVSVTGNYLNFNVNRMIQIQHILKEVIAKGDRYGLTNEGAGKKIIVEFSSPNIAKPFHAGHLRSTIIGGFMVNIFKALGYEVTSINYLGDWGKQYGILAVGFEKYGNEQELLADPIKHLFNVYVKINIDIEAEGKMDEKDRPSPTIDERASAYFKSMEEGNEAALAVWKRFRDLSIEKYKQLYSRLNINFDMYSGESLMCPGMIKAYDILVSKDLIQDSKGAKIIDLSDQKLDKVIVKKSNGATLYITRDISAAIYRKEDLTFDKMYYVVASQQNFHFQQLFAIMGKMGYEWSKDLVHINYGMVLGMSTRKGTVVFLEDILNKAKSKMLKKMKENETKFAEIADPESTADILGISAVYIQDFSAKRGRDYEFNWDRMLQADGDTGVYLQYAHARLCSLARKSGATFNPNADLSLLTEPEAFDLAITIGRYPEVIQQSVKHLEPSTVTTYLFELAHAVSRAHSALWIKDQEKNLAEARFALYWAAKTILSSGMKLLSLVPLELM